MSDSENPKVEQHLDTPGDRAMQEQFGGAPPQADEAEEQGSEVAEVAVDAVWDEVFGDIPELGHTVNEVGKAASEVNRQYGIVQQELAKLASLYVGRDYAAALTQAQRLHTFIEDLTNQGGKVLNKTVEQLLPTLAKDVSKIEEYSRVVAQAKERAAESEDTGVTEARNHKLAALEETLGLAGDLLVHQNNAQSDLRQLLNWYGGEFDAMMQSPQTYDSQRLRRAVQAPAPIARTLRALTAVSNG